MAKFNENQSHENGDNNNYRKKEFEIRIPKLILRNLSFKLNQDDLKSELSKYGKIDEVCIPKKGDGTQCGYGFVKYSTMNEAKHALDTINKRKEKMLGTKVVVDWCLPKRLYLKNRDGNMAESAAESVNGKRDSKKVEEDEDEPDSGDEGDDDDQDEDDGSEGADDDEDGSEKEDANEEESDKDEDDDEEKEQKVEKKVAKKSSKFDLKAKSGTKDVQEKRTVFIRNLSYDTTLEGMNKAFERFGKIKNSFLCYDKDFERPKGTGFIQFEEAQSAINACAESNLLEIDSRMVQIDMALSRTQVKGVVDERKTKEPKDNRNLALAKFGVIYANSYEGKELSKTDLDKRAKIEASNRAKLKLLHYFVSPTRLSVHNIPIKCTDEQLKKIFLNVFDENERKSVRLVECRIMRDLTRVNSEGVAKSKGFGFVEFKSFDHALKALKATNNNPELFDDKKTRLIVQFSIEDMRALKKKERRVSKNQNKNRILSRKNDARRIKRDDRNDDRETMSRDEPKEQDKTEHNKMKNKNLINVELIQKKIKRKLEEEEQEQKSKGNKKQKTDKNSKKNVKSNKKNTLDKKRKMQKRKIKQSVKPNKREKTDYVDDLVNKYVKAKEGKRPKRKWFE